MLFQSEGKITYDPTAGKAKNDWWVILDCDSNIQDYYYKWILKSLGIKLNKPLFGSHISVVRGEQPSIDSQTLWKKHSDRLIEFDYSYEVETDGDYWWLPVRSYDLSLLREELGLSSEPLHGFHLTIGRTIV